MATKLHTFIDIFNTDFEIDEEMVRLNQIIIPIIQRDYAQGRTDGDASRVRERFLESLYGSITDKPITLDFVYGDLDKDGVMTPLDGQQRLTTLFLLHWYAAKKEKLDKDDYGFLKNFSYETRYSAREFCRNLIENYEPSFEGLISEEIVDQSWFPLDWKKDPTIGAMLVMLDAISDKFKDTEDIWSRLNGGAIRFYFLPIRDMGLTDELYIKMNSRGKPLTLFENFKAELEKELKKIDEEVANRIIRKIDIDWTDMLWRYRGDNNITDDEFLRYFRFITDIICYKAGGTTQGKKQDEFDILKTYYSAGSENAESNIALLESYYDVWCEVSKEQPPKEFLEKFIALEHEEGKVQFENKLDIFEDCLNSYADVLGNGNRNFPLNRIILLYAIVTYLQNRKTITEEQFRRRLRVVHNLVRNSEDEISDSETRTAGNRMPAILRQVDSVIIDGVINENETPNFNSYQLEEEKEKIQWTDDNASLSESLFKLEDYSLLKGQIGIVGTEEPDNFEKFQQLFDCNWDLVDCALMATDDYKQCERNGWRHQLGSSKMEKAWFALFHKSRNKGYEKTKATIHSLLGGLNAITDESLKKVADEYIDECEKKSEYPWRYYYIKYKEFRPGKYGKVSWRDLEHGFYDMHVLWAESQWSKFSYHPFLYEAAKAFINQDELGHYLLWNNMKVACENPAFVFYEPGTENEVSRIDIEQTEEGIDKEDRIIKLRSHIAGK